ncbi:MAG TPA: tRNA (adenosine(37)-N6)-threonylcarbamoyltransferase complex ATPase subunit type 1 TsaE [Nitriliruptorales bacterium]
MITLPLRCRTNGPDDTRALAAAAAATLEPGDVVALTGELGAGKTCFVQGAATELGVEGRVTSPTFVLVRTYEGRIDLVHVDVYRLDNLAEVRDLGEQVFATDVITFLEWGDAVEPVLPDDRLEVEIVLGEDPDDREVWFRAHGDWDGRRELLVAALADWTITAEEDL